MWIKTEKNSGFGAFLPSLARTSRCNLLWSPPSPPEWCHLIKKEGLSMIYHLAYGNECTAKTQYRKIRETSIPRKGIARPQSQFPHSCVCERFIYSHDRYSHDRSAYSAGGKYVDLSWENIYRSQTHEYVNRDGGRVHCKIDKHFK